MNKADNTEQNETKERKKGRECLHADKVELKRCFTQVVIPHSRVNIVQIRMYFFFYKLMMMTMMIMMLFEVAETSLKVIILVGI